MPDIYYSDNRNHEPRLYWASIVGLPKWIYAKSRNSPFAHDRTRDRKIPEIVKDKPVYGAGRGADCRFVLILNKLLKTLDAQNYQNAGNAVLKYTIRTRDFRPMDSALGRIDCRRGSSLPDLRGSHAWT